MADLITRLALVGPSAEVHKGGIAHFTSRLAEALGVFTSVAFFSWTELYPRRLLGREVVDTVSRAHTPSAPATFTLAYSDPRTWARLVDQIAAFDPQRIVLTWVHPVHAPVYLALIPLLRRRTRAEIVFVCHNILPHEGFVGAGLLTRLCLGRADRLVVHSASEVEEARRVVGAPVTRLFLPLHDLFGPPLPKGPPGHRMLFFGAVRPYKGLDVLLAAMPAVLARYHDAHLTVAGELYGAEADPRPRVEASALGPHVDLRLGYVPNEAIPPLFAAADVAVFPFRSATQSGSITVAFSYDTPVVASAVGGVPDVVEEGVSGLLVPPGDPAALAEALCRFFAAPIPAAGVRRAAGRLSWATYAQALASASLP